MNRNTMLNAALDLARNGWSVFPCWERSYSKWQTAKAPVADAAPNGLLNATSDVDTIVRWWSKWPLAIIGARVPDPLMVIDVDPRHRGDITLDGLEERHGSLPTTLTTWSGRGDGGSHRWFYRPPGKLRGKNLGTGIDLKTSTGYVIVPPSPHPDTGQPYRWEEHPIAEPPPWLVDLLVPPPAPAPKTRRTFAAFTGPSVADLFSSNTSWHDILTPHGWRCLDNDGQADGARWLHPNATSACSATVRHGCLFVYSTNTPFEITEPGNPHGYTPFRAWAVLEHGGNMSAAAVELMGGASRAS